MTKKTIGCLEDFYYQGNNSSALKMMSGMVIAIGMVCFGWGLMVGLFGIFKTFLFLV